MMYLVYNPSNNCNVETEYLTTAIIYIPVLPDTHMHEVKKNSHRHLGTHGNLDV